MSGLDDAKELLDASDRIIYSIRTEYERARFDEDISGISRVNVKSALEHTRSALEYTAVEIYKSYSKKETKVYFPYGRTEKIFLQSVNKNLPGLARQSQDLFSIVESIQPHMYGADWLIKLCDATNFRKHNQLGSQRRRVSRENTVKIGNFFTMIDCEDMTFEGNTFNGVSMSPGKVVISSSIPIREIQHGFNPAVSVSRVFEWVEFALEDVDYDVLKLLATSSEEVRKVVEGVQSLLE
jgi:hypothetical protein